MPHILSLFTVLFDLVAPFAFFLSREILSTCPQSPLYQIGSEKPANLGSSLKALNKEEKFYIALFGSHGFPSFKVLASVAMKKAKPVIADLKVIIASKSDRFGGFCDSTIRTATRSAQPPTSRAGLRLS